jgi:hypothetical protein
MKMYFISCALLTLSVGLVLGWYFDHEAQQKDILKYLEINRKSEARNERLQEANTENLETKNQTLNDLRALTSRLNNSQEDRDFAYRGWDGAKQDFKNIKEKLDDLNTVYNSLNEKYQELQQTNKRNYDWAILLDQQSHAWRKLAYQNNANGYVSSSTTDFQPEAMSNPAARQAFAPNSSLQVIQPPMSGAVEDSYFLPPTTTAIDPQTGNTIVIH